MLICYNVTRLDFPADLETLCFRYGSSVPAVGSCVGKLVPRVAMEHGGTFKSWAYCKVRGHCVQKVLK